MKKKLLIVASLSGALVVGLGAFGAHGLKSIVSEDSLKVFHTGVEYQFYHTLAMLFTGLLIEKFPSRFITAAGVLFIAGIILFSGSLYLLSTIESLRWLGAVTPIGGLCFIAGWISLAIGVYKSQVMAKKIPPSE